MIGHAVGRAGTVIRVKIAFGCRRTTAWTAHSVLGSQQETATTDIMGSLVEDATAPLPPAYYELAIHVRDQGPSEGLPSQPLSSPSSPRRSNRSLSFYSTGVSHPGFVTAGAKRRSPPRSLSSEFPRVRSSRASSSRPQEERQQTAVP